MSLSVTWIAWLISLYFKRSVITKLCLSLNLVRCIASNHKGIFSLQRSCLGLIVLLKRKAYINHKANRKVILCSKVNVYKNNCSCFGIPITFSLNLNYLLNTFISKFSLPTDSVRLSILIYFSHMYPMNYRIFRKEKKSFVSFFQLNPVCV